MNSMHVTMVKKRLLNGEPCKKCVDAEKLLETRGLMSRIDEVVWAVEGEPQSAGMKLAKEHHVDLAPFFVVRDDSGNTRIYTSTLQFMKEALVGAPVNAGASASAAAPSAEEIATLALEFDKAPP